MKTIMKPHKDFRKQTTIKTWGLFLVLFISYTAQAETYTYKANEPEGGWAGVQPKWTDEARWDTYPGTTINSGDQVLIYGRMFIATTVVNNGYIIIKNRYEWCIASLCYYKEKGSVTVHNNPSLFLGAGSVTNNGNFIVENTGTLGLYGGTFHNNASLANDGSMSSDYLSAGNGTLNVNSGATVTNSGSFNNFGGDIVISSGGHFNNLGHLGSVAPSLAVGTINLNQGGTLSWKPSNSGFPDAAFTWNGGNFVVSAGGLTSVGTALTIPNNGTLTVNGTFSYNSTLTNNGNIILNGNLAMNSPTANYPTGNLTWNSGGTVTVSSITENEITTPVNIPAGGTLISTGVLKLSGLVSNSGTLAASNGGSLTIGHAYNFETGEESILSGGTFNIGATENLNLNSALTISANGILNIYGKLNLNPGGSIVNNGSLVLKPGGEYLLNYPNAFFPSGTVDWQDGGAIGLGVNGTALVEDFNFPISRTVSAGKVFVNHGTFSSNVSDLFFLVEGQFDNFGTSTFSQNLSIIGTANNHGTLTANGFLGIDTFGRFNQNAGTLNLNKEASYDLEMYRFKWNGGNINISAISSADFYQSPTPANGTLTNNGRVDVPPFFEIINNADIVNNGYMRFGENDFINNGTITNNDTLIVPALGFLYNHDIIINNTNGKLINEGDFWNYQTLTNTGNFKNKSFFKNKSTFTNSGIFSHESGNFVIATQPNIIFPGGTFNWGGTVTLDTSTNLTLTSDFTVPESKKLINIGSIMVNSGGDLIGLANSEINNYGLLQLNGTGDITLSSGELILNTGGVFELNNSSPAILGSLTWVAGDMTVGTLADLTIREPVTIPAGSNLNVNGILRVGQVGYSGGITNNGNFVLNASGSIYFNTGSDLGQMTWSSGGKIIVNPAVGFSINNALTIPNGGIFENYGNVQISTGSNLNLASGSIFNIYDGASMSISEAITNNGAINVKSGAEYILRYNTTLPVPSANFNWEVGGTLASGGGAYLSLASPYTVPAGRILKMDGGVFTVNKKLSNDGIINLTGNLTITDTLEQNKDLNFGLLGKIRLQSTGALILNDTISYAVTDTIHNDGGLVKINQAGALIGDGVVKLKGGLPANENGRLCLNQTIPDFDLTKIVWNDGSSIIIGENSTYDWPNGFTIPSNKKFHIDGLMTIKTDSTLENNGYLTVNGTLNDNGTLNNNAGSTFINNGLSNINGTFLNNGIMENTSTLNLNATGSLTLNTGNITLDGSFNWLAGGDLTIGPNANMYLANTLTIPAAATLNVDGLLQINPNGDIANNGTLSLNATGNFVIKDTTNFITSANFVWNTGADVTIRDGGLVSLSQPFTIPTADSLIIEGGTLELNPGAVVTNNGTLDLNAHGNIILNESPDFLVNGNFNWNTQGIVTLGSGITFDVTMPLNIGVSAVLVNNGKIIIPSGGSINNGGTITNNDSLINNGTVVNTQSNNSFIYNYGAFINNGVINNDKWFHNEGHLVLNTPGNTFPALHLSSNTSGVLIIGQNGILDISENVESSIVRNLWVEGTLNINDGASYTELFELKDGGKIKLNTYASYKTGDGFKPVALVPYLLNDFDWNTNSTLEVSALGELTLFDTLKIPTNGKLIVNGILNIERISSDVDYVGFFKNDGILELNSGGNFNFKSPTAIFPEGNFQWNGGGVNVFANTTLALESPFIIPTGRTLSNSGTLNINSSGVLECTGTLSNLGNLNINASGKLTEIGTLTNTGTFNLNTDGEYRIKKAVASLPASTFNWNAGKLTLDTASVFDLTNSLLIPTGGTLGIEKNAVLNVNTVGVLTEQGALEINEGNLNLNTSGQLILDKANAAIPGTGFAWNAGTLKIGSIGTLSLANVLNIPATGIFEINGLLAIDNGGSVNNLGVFNLNNRGNLDFNTATASLPTGTFNWLSGGDIKVNAGSTFSLINALEIPTSSTLINNGTFNINNLGILSSTGAYTSTGVTNLNSGGKYLITGALTSVPNTNFNWNTGGIFEISSTGSLTLGDSLSIPYQRQLVNKGQLNINQNGVLTQMGAIDNQGTFDLNDMGYLILKTSPLEPTPASVAYPNGSFNWNNGGVIKIDSFTVFDNAAPFTVVANRELIICGTFNNTSTLDINGKISLAGNLTNTDAISLKLGGELNFLTPTVTFPAGNFDWQAGGDISISPQSTLTLASSLTVPEFSSLKNEGTLTINASGVLVLNGDISGNGTLNLNSAGKFLVNSTVNPSLTLMNWNPGGEIEIGASGIMEIEEPFEIPYGGIFTNKGTVNIGDGSIFSTAKLTQSGTFDNSLGNLILQPYGTLEYKTAASDPGPSTFNYPAGTFDWQSAGIVKIAANTVFDNQSPFDVQVSRELIVDGTFKNNSTLAINGTLTANGDLTNEATGIINLNNGGNLVIYKEDFTKPGNTFNWASGGTFTIGDTGSMDVTTAFGIPAGGILNIEGALSLKAAGVINNLGTIELSYSGDLLLDYDDAPLPTGNFNWNGRVTFAENRTFNISENYVVPGSGNLKNEGIVFINPEGSLMIDGLFFNDSLLTNNGTIEVNEFGYIANYVAFTNNDTLLNKGIIENYGPFINAANGNLINRLDFYNYDTLYNHGILSGNNGKIYAETDSELENFAGSKVSPGEGQSSGKMSVQGDFNLGNATQNTEIDGSTNGDLLDVRDHATLTNATLDVKWLNNPSNNQIDTVLAFGTKTGEFASINIQALSGYTFTVNYLENAVVIQSASDCQTSISETSSLSGTQTISSGQSINASAVISINARVTFSTGGSITLEPGFKTENNAVFLANIDGGCAD